MESVFYTFHIRIAVLYLTGGDFFSIFSITK